MPHEICCASDEVVLHTNWQSDLVKIKVLHCLIDIFAIVSVEPQECNW